MRYVMRRYPDIRIAVKGVGFPQTGYGAYGLVMRYEDHTVEQCGAAWDATHNQMELVAAIEALRLLHRPSEIAVHSSSEYFIKCARGEYHRGRYFNLWDELASLAEQHVVGWHWIRDSPELDRAHELARQATPFIL
jgi:ribonuclease HI